MSVVDRFAAQGDPVCGSPLPEHDDVTCLLPPHPHEGENVEAHVTLIDGSPVQWVEFSESSATRVDDGAA